MRGFPKTISTKSDVNNLLLLYPVETKKYLKEIIDNRFVWRSTGAITEGAAGVQDATHRVIATHRVMRTESGLEQFELVEDANAKIFRIGFTVSEVEEILK